MRVAVVGKAVEENKEGRGGGLGLSCRKREVAQLDFGFDRIV